MSLSIRSIFWGLSALYFLIGFTFLDSLPLIAIDESWIANTAHNFATGNGLINTVPGYHGQQFFMFHTLCVSFFFKLFGTSLWVGRLCGVVLGWLGLIGMIQILNRFKISPPIILLGGLLFLVSNVFFIIFRWIRPEGFVVAMLIWSLFCLIKAWQDNTPHFLMITGFFSSMATMSHPHGVTMGICFGLGILYYCYFNRSVAPMVYFLGGVLITLSLVCLNLFLRDMTFLDFVRLRFSDNRLTFQSQNYLLGIYANFVQLFQSYTLGWKRLFILVCELSFLGIGLTQYKKNTPLFFLSLLGVISLFMGVLVIDPFRRRYFGMIIFVSILCLCLLLNQLGPKKRRLGFGIAILYLLNNLAGDGYLALKQMHTTPFSIIESAVRTHIPSGARVMTHLELWLAAPHTTVIRANDHPETESLDYVLITPHFAKAISPTTLDQTDFYDVRSHETDLYTTLHQYASQHGQLVHSIPTVGYDTIQIWKIW